MDEMLTVDRSPIDDAFDEICCYWCVGVDTGPQDGIRYVYFIACDDANAVKIGITRDPQERLAALQAGCPLQLRLAALIQTEPDTRQAADLEKQLHAAFRAWRIHGEWFIFADSVREYCEIVRQCEECVA